MLVERRRCERRASGSPRARRDDGLVSRAPLDRLQAYKRRIGWSFPWVSAADYFNFDFGVSYTDEQVREGMGSILEGDTPPVFSHLASATGTDVAGYLSEGPGMSAFALADGAVHHPTPRTRAAWSS